MKEYGYETRPIPGKYTSYAAQYYKRRLAARALGLEFTDTQPPRNFEEVWETGKGHAAILATKAEKGIKYVGNKIESKVIQYGIKDKVMGLFKP